ncbi:hypothetical protein [Gloeothece verrucosa]|uniref:Uncharacterized protein n=1 Tax=Gloeothece verrucosa (strain PCC 7822) TaxID=497965 RepID=E0U5G0_GLOV7|nr:hypothetical protein [Gloeothece verrucosa]ADN13550.1 conserved hypothetical protein [Gloeothece verrucosa PCC 7822]
MTTYVTQEGFKLTTNSSVELIKQLQEIMPRLSSAVEDRSNAELASVGFCESSMTLNADDPENSVAELIQQGYLRVIDEIDG